MMMGKLVECLYRRQALVVKVYDVFIHACYVFEKMNCGIVILRMCSISVQGKKGECRDNGRASAGLQSLDAANNTLIDLFLA